MALALLRLEDGDDQQLALDIDTGTSPYYRIHLGKEVRREDGFTLLDQILWSSPVRRNPSAGRHLDTHTRAPLDPSLVTERGMLVQLESMRDPSGRGPAWSRPMRLSVPVRVAAMSAPFGAAASSYAGREVVVRTVPVRTARETYSRPASLEDLLGAVVRVAGPVVQGLLQQPSAGAAAPGTGAPAAGGATPAAAGSDPTAAAIAALLQTVLGALTRGGGPLATTASLEGNRLTGRTGHATPFIFGVDDALIAAVAAPVIAGVAGPLVQALPQLFNAANQQKLESRRESHQHIAEILAQVDRSRLLEQLLAARSSAPATPPADAPPAAAAAPALSEADLAALIGLLQAGATTPAPTGTPAAPAATAPPAPAPTAAAPPAPAPTGAAPPAAPPPAAATGTPAPTGTTAPAGSAPPAATAPGAVAPVRTASLSISAPDRPARPSRAVLTLVTGPAVDRMGTPSVQFLRGRALTLRFRLEVPPDGPTTAVPRALLTLVVREPGGATDLLVRQERLTALRPGEVRSVSLTAAEVDALPADTDLDLTAALRWPGRQETWQATCSQRVVLTRPQQVVGTGAVVGERRELVDIARYRAFWNRTWSSPTSDDSGKGPMWGLDVAMRYSVVATNAASNGLMETRLRAEPQEHDSVRVSATGQMKSGVELALAELNALLPLWPGEQPLDTETFTAFTAAAHLARQGGDVVHRVRLEGKRGTRGAVWVVPVPTLRSFTVATVRETDAFGQVLTLEPREVHFPVVEAVRVLGLVSSEDASEATPDGYRFEGYDVGLDELVALEPAVPMRPTTAPSATQPATAGGG